MTRAFTYLIMFSYKKMYPYMRSFMQQYNTIIKQIQTILIGIITFPKIKE
jgi:hypothetical protein